MFPRVVMNSFAPPVKLLSRRGVTDFPYPSCNLLLSIVRNFHCSPVCWRSSRMRKRPLMDGFEKRLLRAMTAPVYPKEIEHQTTMWAESPYQKHLREFNDYMIWLITGTMARQEVYAFYYCTKPEDRVEWAGLQQSFRKSGLMLQDWKAEYIRRAVVGTKFENLVPILNENVLLCHIYEPISKGMPKGYVPPPPIEEMTAVKEMIRLGRIVPKLTLLGGVVENHLMTRTSFIAYSELENVDLQRGQLSTILSGTSAVTSGILLHHQRLLSLTLETLARERGSEGLGSPASGVAVGVEDRVSS